MKKLNRFTAAVSAVVMCLSLLPAPMRTSARSESSSEKRIIVSLGDSYSSGEGIEPFYGQDNIVEKLINDRPEDQDDIQDWLAHRSKECWSGRLTLDGKKMKRDDNWYFAASSGAVINDLNYKQEKTYNLVARYCEECGIDKIGKKILDMNTKNIDGQIFTMNELYSIKSDEVYKLCERYKLSDKDSEALIKYVNVRDKLFAEKEKKITPQLDVFDKIKDGKVAYVTMTLSGNDIGFADIIIGAVLRSIGDNYADTLIESGINSISIIPTKVETTLCVNGLTEELQQKYEDFDNDNGIGENLKKAYGDIQEKAGKDAKLIIAGYPHLLTENGCGLFTKEACKQINKYTSMFNNKIKKVVDDCRAEGLNTFFVSVEGNEYFGGHGAYSNSSNKKYGKNEADGKYKGLYKGEFINRIQYLKSEDLEQSKFPPISIYSIHPNTFGAQVYADAVQEKIDALEDNCFVSGNIYKNSNKDSIGGISPKVVSVAAVNTDSGKKIKSYPNKTDVIMPDSFGQNETGAWNQLQTISYNDSGYFEFILPEGNYNLEITLSDGTTFTVAANKTDPSVPAEISAKKKDLVRDIEIDLEGKCLINANYEWYLEPSVAADDIYSVDSDETCIDQTTAERIIQGFAIGGKNTYDVYSTAVFRIGGTVGLIDNSGNVLETNEKHNCLYIMNGKISVGYLYNAGWPGDPRGYYEYDKAKGILIGDDGNLYSGDKTVLVGTHDDKYNWKYGLYKKDRFIISVEYENGKMNYASNNGIFALCRNGKWGYFNSDGKQIIDFVCDPLEEISNGVLSLKITGWGTDETGQTIEEVENTLPCNDIYMSSDGYIPVKINGSWALYDVNGNEIIPPDTFDEIRPVHNDLAWVKDKKSGLWGVIKLLCDVDTSADTVSQSDDYSVWKKLYRDKINDTYNEAVKNNRLNSNGFDKPAYDIIDLNRDGIPELIISDGESHSALAKVYIVCGGKLCDLGACGNYGKIGYNSTLNCIANGDVKNGIESFVIYAIENGKLIRLSSGWSDAAAVVDNPTYEIDGESVSQADFEAASRKYGFYGNESDLEYYGRDYELFNDLIEQMLS